MRMNREAAEELYDPKRISFRQAMKEITAVMKANPKLTPSEAETIVWKKHTGKTYDPKRKRKKSAWLTFVMAHKHMRTKKGLLDLKAISKLWKMRKKSRLTAGVKSPHVAGGKYKLK